MKLNGNKVTTSLAALTAAAAVAAASPAAAASHHNGGRSDPRHLVADHYTRSAMQGLAPHTVVVSGLDNPRQLAWGNSGGLLIAEAGHGSYNSANCSSGGPEGNTCIGRSGKISRVVHPGKAVNHSPHRIAKGFLSGASPDGTFAVGSDGVDQGPGGGVFVQETFAPPDVIPQGLGGRQSGKLMTSTKRIVANISAYEFKHNPDGESKDSDPYAVLALKGRQLVADAAGDDILRVMNGKLSVWAKLPGDTSKVDPVPTSLAKGRHGSIYVGTLYSLKPHKARVLKYSKHGKLLKAWGNFTSVTGVAVNHGKLYVSQLFAGCAPNDQTCLPGRLTKVAADGTRTTVRVPFPAGLAVHKGHLYVSAWSIAPSKGAFGAPDSSGQVWRLDHVR